MSSNVEHGKERITNDLRTYSLLTAWGHHRPLILSCHVEVTHRLTNRHRALARFRCINMPRKKSNA